MARELTLVEKGLVAGDRGDGDGREAGVGNLLQRPDHQLGLEQRKPALEAIGTRTRNLDDAGQISPVVLLDQRDMVERLECELARGTLRADDRVEALVR